jgi:hypothetical protein
MSAGMQDRDVHRETPVATYSGFIALVVGIALLGFAVYLLYGGTPRVGLFNHRKGPSVPPEAEQRIYGWFEAYG